MVETTIPHEETHKQPPLKKLETAEPPSKT